MYYMQFVLKNNFILVLLVDRESFDDRRIYIWVIYATIISRNTTADAVTEFFQNVCSSMKEIYFVYYTFNRIIILMWNWNFRYVRYDFCLTITLLIRTFSECDLWFICLIWDFTNKLFISIINRFLFHN